MIRKFLVLAVLLALSVGPLFALADLGGITLCIDPGHGGTDPGAIGATGLKEAETVLQISKLVRDKLKARGAAVQLTREDNSTLSLSSRTNFANALKADRLVSIHLNAFNKTSNYTLMLVYLTALETSTSTKIAAIISRDINAEIGLSYAFSNFTPQVPGVRKENLHMVRESAMPAVLTESSFIDYPAEEVKLKDPAYLAKVATIIYGGICKHYEVDPNPPPVPTPPPAPTTGSAKLTATMKNKYGNFEPLAGGQVTLYYRDGSLVELVTSETGKAIFTGLNAGPVELFARKTGFFGLGRSIELVAATSKSTTIYLAPKFNTTESENQNFGSMIGIITDGVDDKRLTGAKSYLLFPKDPVDLAFSNSTGIYNFPDLPSGVYTVHTTLAGYAPAAQSVMVTAGVQKWNSFKLSRLTKNYASISGNIYDLAAGTAIRDVTLSLYNGTALLAIMASDAAGKFAFNELEPGTYKITCKPPVGGNGYRSTSKSSLVISEGKNLQQSFGLVSAAMSGAISGHVFRYEATRKVAAMLTPVQVYKGGTLVTTAHTGWGASAGMFSVSGLLAGTYDVKVGAITRSVKVTAGSATALSLPLN